MTRQQQLIGQLRNALHILQSPTLADYNDAAIFEIADTEFSFTIDELNELVVGED